MKTWVENVSNPLKSSGMPQYAQRQDLKKPAAPSKSAVYTFRIQKRKNKKKSVVCSFSRFILS